MSQYKPTSWNLVTQVCLRDYRNKNIPESLQLGEEQWVAWHTLGSLQRFGLIMSKVWRKSHKLVWGVGLSDTWSTGLQDICKDWEMVGKWERANIGKREKRVSPSDLIWARGVRGSSQTHLLYFRDLTLCVAECGRGWASNHNEDKRSLDSPLWMDWLFELIQPLAWSYKAKWLSDLCRDGPCTLRAISTLWYSTELMAISQNKDKHQIQKVSLWTKPGILFVAHYLLFEKKGLGEVVNCQRAERPGQNRASGLSGPMSSGLEWVEKDLFYRLWEQDFMLGMEGFFHSSYSSKVIMMLPLGRTTDP